ncbi:MAG: helix-turn-helix transcriptional regulator [Clostridia bacterium]|nr:helix-turn-helix transcriptional regulator [Clostridia bacterium]
MSFISYREIGKDPMYKIWHSTGLNVIIYIHSDGGNIVFEDCIYPMKKGALCFIGAKKIHYTMPDDPQIYTRSKIFLTSEEHLDLVHFFSGKSSFCNYFSEDRAVYAHLPEEMQKNAEQLITEINNSQKSKYSDTKLLCNYMTLLTYIDMYSSEKQQISAGFAHEALNFINRSISENISIDDICSHLHMSKYHFCRKFKSITGITVMDYILKTRIAMAQKMLSSTTMSVGEISEKCGFSGISYFCRIFKEQTGKTPLKYRKTER